MAIWNSRMSRASSSACPATCSNSAIAPAIAAHRRSASRSGSSAERNAAARSVSDSTNSRLRARPGDAGRPVRRSSVTAVAFVEVAAHQIDQGLHRLRRVAAVGAEMQGRALGCLERHHLHDALGIDPRAAFAEAELDLAGEGLGELGELHGRARMQADLMRDDDRSGGGLVRGGPVLHRAEYSSAVCRTTSTLDPPDASVAATTAPSTSGALQISTLPRRSSGSISIAISLLVSAPPRSTSTTTPALDQARSIAAMICPTSVPRPPEGLPPVQAKGTSSPTIWRTMSAAPSATLGECETMTTPTLSITLSPELERRLRSSTRATARRGPYARSIGLRGTRRGRALP